MGKALQLDYKRKKIVKRKIAKFHLNSEDNFANETLNHHLEVMAEMIDRDKNHPSVVMWSLANEPHSQLPIAKDYFKYYNVIIIAKNVLLSFYRVEL